MTNERSNISVSDSIANGRIDQIGKEGDSDAELVFQLSYMVLAYPFSK